MTQTLPAPLIDRPGFLIRRLHQIHQAIFAEECGAFDVTPMQFSIMSVAGTKPGLDQTALAHEIGVDRTTLANVVARLEKRGILRRTRSQTNHRLKCVHLTASGQRIVQQMEGAVARAHHKTIEALPKEEREAFTAALRILVNAGNDYAPAILHVA